MAQGKARNKKKTLEALKPYFQLGCSVRKACEYAGISPNTIYTWVADDEALRVQITAWQNEISAIARKNLSTSIRLGSVTTSESWLSKKERDEFAGRTEITGADGEALGGLSAGDREALNKLHDILKQQ